MLKSRAYSILLVKLQQLTMMSIAENGSGPKSEEVEIDQAQAKNEPEAGEAHMDASEDGPAHKPETEDGNSQMEELEDGVANMGKPEDGEEYILGQEYEEEYMLELEDDEEYTCCICLKQCYSAAKLFHHQKICDTKLYKYECACGRMTENAHQMAGHHNTCGLKHNLRVE
ncbi:hypothetical protein KR054_006218 [Drosophila jambulina]|nr:hypothetical protein KR054_006218 [Drosophila jambulina]